MSLIKKLLTNTKLNINCKFENNSNTIEEQNMDKDNTVLPKSYKVINPKPNLND